MALEPAVGVLASMLEIADLGVVALQLLEHRGHERGHRRLLRADLLLGELKKVVLALLQRLGAEVRKSAVQLIAGALEQRPLLLQAPSRLLQARVGLDGGFFELDESSAQLERLTLALVGQPLPLLAAHLLTGERGSRQRAVPRDGEQPRNPAAD